MIEVTPCLWFADEAEAAARFYVSLLPDSHIIRVARAPANTPYADQLEDRVLTVQFVLAGRPFTALNGGSPLAYTNALSLALPCESQAEIDRLWDALIDGGQAQRCGWLNDRWGVPWQIFPAGLDALLGDPIRGARVMEAMIGMTKLDMAALERAAG